MTCQRACIFNQNAIHASPLKRILEKEIEENLSVSTQVFVGIDLLLYKNKIFLNFIVSSDSGGLPGFRGGDRDGCLSQRHGLPGSRLSAMCQQSGHCIPCFLRFGPYYCGCNRLLPSLPYQSGQCGHADSRQSRRHHLLGTSLLDCHRIVRMYRQTRLGSAPRHSLLRPCNTALGMDCQEK